MITKQRSEAFQAGYDFWKDLHGADKSVDIESEEMDLGEIQSQFEAAKFTIKSELEDPDSDWSDLKELMDDLGPEVWKGFETGLLENLLQAHLAWHTNE